jgi:hypothetical protein
MINRGNLLAAGSVTVLVMLSLLTGCRSGDHGCQIMETSLRWASLSPSMYRWVVWIDR